MEKLIDLFDIDDNLSESELIQWKKKVGAVFAKVNKIL